jgi:hypothetical protein
MILSLSLVTGCGIGGRPRIRVGYYPSSTIGTVYLGPDNLGTHGYSRNFSEKTGVVYTCKAGHVDISHVRISADWTKYLAEKTYDNLITATDYFSFGMNVEPTKHHIYITYPADWENKPQEEKERIARDISLEVGRYASFTAANWHEILTWFHFHCIVFLPEYPSAFSWEDTFSNLLGTDIAVEAMKSKDLEFNEAVTKILNEELQKLDIQSAKVARDAADSVRGTWFARDSVATIMRKRNFDIGIGDGLLTPTLVPGVAECEGASPVSYPTPNLDFAAVYGFEIRFEIEPKAWERGQILNIVYPDKADRVNRIEPDIHFPIIMEWIMQDGIRKYGEEMVQD